ERADQSDLADVAVRRSRKTQRRTRWRFPAPENGTSANTDEDQFHTTAVPIGLETDVDALKAGGGPNGRGAASLLSKWR
ncbi:MAG: hypothetical protein ACJ79V_10805, partial [Myxococcales bacterium]